MTIRRNRLVSLFAELKRRRVVRVALAYAVAAYAVVQAASTFFPPLHVPDWVLTVLAVVAVLGFIPAVALSWAFDWTSAGLQRTPPAVAGLAVGTPPGRSRVLGFALVGGVLVLSGVWFAAARPPRASSGDANVVAVLPFRVSAADPAMSYLREGMLDLLAAKLTGEGVPRAVDPRTLLSAWRRVAGEADDLAVDQAMEFARRLGAGLLLTGEVVGTPMRVTLSASLLQVADGRMQARSTVEGPPDSLAPLVDRLAGELLAERAGEGTDRMASLTSTSLPALQAYLAGQHAFRRGEFQAAVDAFERALAADSTFALAGLGLETAYNWSSGDDDLPRNEELVWRLRSRLSHRDQLLLDATMGPSFPAPPSAAQLFEAGERAVAAAPDRAEAWVAWGDWLFHLADVAQAPEGHTQAKAAFRRALELDSSYAAPLVHLTEIALREGDLAGARRYAHMFLTRDSAGEHADFLRWRLAVAEGDTAERATVRGRFDRASTLSLMRIIGTADLDGIAPEDADAAVRVLQRRPAGWEVMPGVSKVIASALVNRGRLSELNGSYASAVRLDEAMVGGDTTGAGAAVQELAPLAGRESVPADSVPLHLTAIVAVESWRILHGDTRDVARATGLLRKIHDGPRQAAVIAQQNAELLEAMAAVADRRPDAAERLRRLEGMLATGPFFASMGTANLLAARLHEALGDRVGALGATRRRMYHYLGGYLLASYLREEGRLAALTGDRAGAILAYRHYLALRTDPDPSVRPEVERVRAELARLSGEPRR